MCKECTAGGYRQCLSVRIVVQLVVAAQVLVLAALQPHGFSGRDVRSSAKYGHNVIQTMFFQIPSVDKLRGIKPRRVCHRVNLQRRRVVRNRQEFRSYVARTQVERSLNGVHGTRHGRQRYAIAGKAELRAARRWNKGAKSCIRRSWNWIGSHVISTDRDEASGQGGGQ